MISGHHGKSLSVGNSRKKVLRMIKREREQCKMWHLVIMLWLFFPFLFQTRSTTKKPTSIILLCCSLGLARAQLFWPVLSWEYGPSKQQPQDPLTPLPVSIHFPDAGPESKIGKDGRMRPRKLRPTEILGITMVLFVLFFFIILKHFIWNETIRTKEPNGACVCTVHSAVLYHQAEETPPFLNFFFFLIKNKMA